MSRSNSVRAVAFALAANSNQPNRWNRGDFNYDGTAGTGDFALLASDCNEILTSDPPRGGSVPEPAVCIASVSLMAVLRLRQRTDR